MKRVINFRVVEGNPDEIRDNEILVIRDYHNPGKIKDIQKRVNGYLQSILLCYMEAREIKEHETNT